MGQAGEVVSVAAGFARNYLIPQKKALPGLEKYVQRAHTFRLVRASLRFSQNNCFNLKRQASLLRTCSSPVFLPLLLPGNPLSLNSGFLKSGLLKPGYQKTKLCGGLSKRFYPHPRRVDSRKSEWLAISSAQNLRRKLFNWILAPPTRWAWNLRLVLVQIFGSKGLALFSDHLI